jgi:hypothetical protein
MESDNENNLNHEIIMENQNYAAEEQNELEQLEQMRRQQFSI